VILVIIQLLRVNCNDRCQQQTAGARVWFEVQLVIT
tara:strand:- start:825 stop:932 length:108 start_codon:yes stop_codon:yes gene_type:complete